MRLGQPPIRIACGSPCTRHLLGRIMTLDGLSGIYDGGTVEFTD